MGVQVFLERHPVFRHEEFVAFFEANGPRSVKARESALAYYIRTNRILRIRRGLYAVVPQGADPDTYPVDPYLLAAKMTDDAVLAYHTALEFFGKAYSVFQRFHVLTGRAPRVMMFRSIEFRGVQCPKKLREKQAEQFCVTQAERAGLPVMVTSHERTLVDVLDRLELVGGWEEAWRSLEMVEFFDLDDVVDYAILLGNATTVAKVGLFLERHREELMVDDSYLKILRKRRPRSPHYVSRSVVGPHVYIKGWNLVVPREFVEFTRQKVP